MTVEACRTMTLTLALLPALWGCAGTGPPPAGPDVGLARNAIPGLVGRTCDYVSAHTELPSFARLARLGTRGNIALWGHDAAPSDTVVLSVRYDRDGRLAWVRAIHSSLYPDRVASLEALLLATMNDRGPADWGVRLSVIGGDLAAMEPSVVCPVEPRRGARLPVAGPVAGREIRAFEQVRGRRFPIQITVDEQGRILDVRLARSTGHDAVDQFLLDWVLATSFQPRLHDGIALVATTEQTIHIPRRR